MDEQARRALEAAMKIPMSQGGLKPKFITEADLLPQAGTKAEGRCDLCGGAIKHGDGYAFFSSAMIEPLKVPVGNMMLCEKCTHDTANEQTWAVKPSELQFKPPTTEKDLDRLFSGEDNQMEMLNAGGIVATCKRLGLSAEAAKRKARELAVIWWQDSEKGKQETRRFWTSEPKREHSEAAVKLPASGVKELALSEVQKNPQNAGGWFHLATCYLGEANFEGTIEPLKKALSIDDNREEWVRLLAECYIALKNWNEAGPLIMRLVFDHPDWTIVGPSGERITLREALDACALMSNSSPGPTPTKSHAPASSALPRSSMTPDRAAIPGRKRWWQFWK